MCTVKRKKKNHRRGKNLQITYKTNDLYVTYMKNSPSLLWGEVNKEGERIRTLFGLPLRGRKHQKLRRYVCY